MLEKLCFEISEILKNFCRNLFNSRKVVNVNISEILAKFCFEIF